MNRRKAANRRNARRSTGPRSKEGKAAVRLNSIRHGLRATDTLLPEEDGDRFKALHESVHTGLAPVGQLEEFLVDRVVSAIWRLQRIERIETAVLAWLTLSVKADLIAVQVEEFQGLGELRMRSLVDPEGQELAESALEQATRKRDSDEFLIGQAFDADAREGDTFGKLTRYENSIERGLFRSLHELQRLQAGRKGIPVPLPQALELNINDDHHQ